jgi:putative inorganic carbon (hco3(-)) transporter
MAQTAARPTPLTPSDPAGRLVLVSIALLAMALAPAALVMDIPPQILAVIGAALGLVVLALRPDAATLAVVAITYSNAAVVAVRFHDVPFAIAASSVGLLAAPLGYYLLIRREPFVLPAALPWIMGYLLVQLVSTIFAADSGAAAEALGVFITEGVVLYLLVVNAVRSERLLWVTVWTLVVIAAALSVLSIHQEATQSLNNDYFGFAQRGGDPTGLLPGEEFRSRISGPVDGPNRYAQILALIVPLTFAIAWTRASRLAVAAAVVCGGLMLIAIALSLSRGAAVGLALVVMAAFALRYVRWRYLALVGVAAVGVLIAVPQYGQRLQSLDALPGFADEGEEADGSVRSRLTEMVAAALVFVDHPLIGVGPDQFQAYYPEYAEEFGLRVREEEREAHNLYVGIASDSGILGSIAFFGAIGVTMRELMRARRRLLVSNPALAHLAAGFMLAILAYLTTGLFLHLAMERYLWLLLALGAAVVAVSRAVADDPADASLPHAAVGSGVAPRPSAESGSGYRA